MIAVTQARGDGEGAAYYARQLAAGKTVKEALRLLKRRISVRVYRALRAEESARELGHTAGGAPVGLAADIGVSRSPAVYDSRA